PALERKILKLESRRREGQITKGVVTSDKDLQKCLTGLYPPIAEEREESMVIIDGPQRRQTILKVEKRL
ncbi:MAG: hypothetical protein CVV33_05590, partial [Methanomicrobiales archaeon HGW-Methanomicrobiales-4]